MDILDGNRWLSTCDVVYKPDKEKGAEFYVDAEFTGGWVQVDSDNTKNAMSCLG